MHILLIEASLTGHHSIYLERTALAYIEVGHSLTIALPRAVNNSATLKANLEKSSAIQWVEYEPSFDLGGSGVLGLFKREYGMRRVFGQVFRRVHSITPVDYVFLPYMDYFLYVVGLMGSPFGVARFGGICMRPAFHYQDCGVIAPSSKLDVVKKWLFLRLLCSQYLAKLFVIDELLAGYIQLHFPQAAKRLAYLADPADEAIEVNVAQVRALFNAPTGSKVILVYGAIDERKGVSLLLDTLEAERALSEWCVWLVGKQSLEIREWLSSSRWAKLKQQDRVQIRDEFVSDEMEQQVFASCDVVWIVYQGHYAMSGVLVRAGMHSKAVIVCCDGLIGWYARKRHLGVLTEGTDSSVQTAMSTLAKDQVVTEFGSAGFRQFKAHTWKNFMKHLVNGLS